MSAAQPALLYLVPCVLSSITLVGWKRGEIGLLWNGIPAETIVTEPLETDDSKLAEGTKSAETIPLMNMGGEEKMVELISFDKKN